MWHSCLKNANSPPSLQISIRSDEHEINQLPTGFGCPAQSVTAVDRNRERVLMAHDAQLASPATGERERSVFEVKRGSQEDPSEINCRAGDILQNKPFVYLR